MMSLEEFRVHTRQQAEECAQKAVEARDYFRKAAKRDLYWSIFFSAHCIVSDWLDCPWWIVLGSRMMALLCLWCGLVNRWRAAHHYRTFMECRQRCLDAYQLVVDSLTYVREEMEEMMRRQEEHTEGEEWKTGDDCTRED